MIYSEGKTNLKIENKYKVNSEDIYYDRNLNRIYSNKQTLIEDNENNFYILKNGFNFDILDRIIKSKKSIIVDNNSNTYILKIGS